MTTQTDQIIEINVFDNKEYTLDRYTIAGMMESGETFVIASNECMSIWSVSDHYLNAEDVTEEDKHIGEMIDWDQLPKGLQNEVVARYGEV